MAASEGAASEGAASEERLRKGRRRPAEAALDLERRGRSGVIRRRATWRERKASLGVEEYGAGGQKRRRVKASIVVMWCRGVVVS